MSARERGKKRKTLIFPSAQDRILLFHYRLAVYISLFVTLRNVFGRRASCNALRWHKVNTIRRVCIAQYLTVVSFMIRAETESYLIGSLVLYLASHAGVFRGARVSFLCGEGWKTSSLKTPAWEASLVPSIKTLCRC